MLNEIKLITSDELAKSTKSKVEITLEELVKQVTKEKDKRIVELKTQIEKMKCCANCKKYWRLCEYGDREMQICDKWELAND